MPQRLVLDPAWSLPMTGQPSWGARRQRRHRHAAPQTKLDVAGTVAAGRAQSARQCGAERTTSCTCGRTPTPSTALGWCGPGSPFAGATDIDGPVLYGWNGGGLGTTMFGSKSSSSGIRGGGSVLPADSKHRRSRRRMSRRRDSVSKAIGPERPRLTPAVGHRPQFMGSLGAAQAIRMPAGRTSTVPYSTAGTPARWAPE